MTLEQRLLRLVALARTVGRDPSQGVVWTRVLREDLSDPERRSSPSTEDWVLSERGKDVHLSGWAWALTFARGRVFFGGPWEKDPWAGTIRDPDEALQRAELDFSDLGYAIVSGENASERVGRYGGSILDIGNRLASHPAFVFGMVGTRTAPRPPAPALTDGWIPVAWDGLDDGRITRLLAAKEIAGVGVLAQWTQEKEAWSCWVVDTEDGTFLVPSEEEPVPSLPPFSR